LLFWLLRIFIFFWLHHAFHEISFFISLLFSGILVDLHLLHASCYSGGKHVVFVVTKAFTEENCTVSVFRNLDGLIIFYFCFTIFTCVSWLRNRLRVLMVFMTTLAIFRLMLMLMGWFLRR